MSSKSDAAGLLELLMVYAFCELVPDWRIRFVAWDSGFSMASRGLEVSWEEFTDRCFRRSGRRDGRDTTIMAVHISAILHTSDVYISRKFAVSQGTHT